MLLALVFGFTILIWVSARTSSQAPPIPERVVGPAGERLFGKSEILDGQSVFLMRGLMENGSVWGHGGYLGPDFSAEYLHALAAETR